MFQIFDGHNDLLTKLSESDARGDLWPGPNGDTDLDLVRMRQGGFVGGFFAMWMRGPMHADTREDAADGPFEVPLPYPVPLEVAQPIALRQAAHLRWMERQSNGAFKICLTAADLRAAIAAGSIGAILHMEGAEPIDEDLDALYVWHSAGLRSLGPVWSRPTIFGHGVPFSYPATPDIGDGLTDAGKRLIRACDELGIMIDLSHMNEKGFNDVAALSDRPLIATHSNVHRLCTVPRNLTDRQLDVIRASGGMVGLNFATAFMQPNGRHDPATGFDLMLRHIDALLDKLGEDGVALGSDYDGANIPDAIGDVTGGQALCQAMLDHGYGDDLVRKIACENWLAMLDRILT